ncbi:hypothetical protein BN12_1510015 [Nostocoides japonicum T1-X7]|uniref:Uncharacterized protein n=1 Tax=Nostocoides japonicum T1-X7 TaxID=1194083 RepID=A0A077LVQ6_9MICO|nr:hypothetical protein [Tetrasphaera japonica]CCH76902.1 hypothetical protein BN12_1510015 [Tetrasphaera japonica T1-X7]
MTEALDERTRQRLGGGPSVVSGRITAALIALVVVGGDLPRTMTPDDVRDLVEAMTTAGAAMPWQALVVPTLRIVTTGPARSWGHVDEETRQAAREGYGRLLAKRVRAQRLAEAGPVALTPPERPRAVSGLVEAIDGGCGMCGVASVSWSAAEVEAAGGERSARMSAWELRTVEGSSIGRRWPKLLSIWLCSACADATGWTGSLGPSAVERAWSKATGEEVTLETPTPTTWAALVLRARRAEREEPEPNAASWQHYTRPEPVVEVGTGPVEAR